MRRGVAIGADGPTGEEGGLQIIVPRPCQINRACVLLVVPQTHGVMWDPVLSEARVGASPTPTRAPRAAAGAVLANSPGDVPPFWP